MNYAYDKIMLLTSRLFSLHPPFKRNNSDTYDGTFNMLTGTNNIYEMGIVKEWNFVNKTDYYKDSCAIIGGTNGDLWPPLKNNKTADIFVPDICTYVYRS